MTARVVERRIVTVLFADLVGFTALSERLDAEDVSLVQDAYFDAYGEATAERGLSPGTRSTLQPGSKLPPIRAPSSSEN